MSSFFFAFRNPDQQDQKSIYLLYLIYIVGVHFSLFNTFNNVHDNLKYRKRETGNTLSCYLITDHSVQRLT